MKTPNEIKKALACMGSNAERCSYCPYDVHNCVYRVNRDALTYIEELEQRLALAEKKPVTTINGYQAEAMRTASGMGRDYPMWLNGVLGLNGEAGEVADMVKKSMFQGHTIDFEHMAKELGDVAWYVAVTADAIGYDLETILQMNVDKLRKRYPNGFEAERSLHREAGDV